MIEYSENEENQRPLSLMWAYFPLELLKQTLIMNKLVSIEAIEELQAFNTVKVKHRCFIVLFVMMGIQLINVMHSWTVDLKHGM
jgi:hypothetical protein